MFSLLRTYHCLYFSNECLPSFFFFTNYCVYSLVGRSPTRTPQRDWGPSREHSTAEPRAAAQAPHHWQLYSSGVPGELVQYTHICINTTIWFSVYGPFSIPITWISITSLHKDKAFRWKCSFHSISFCVYFNNKSNGCTGMHFQGQSCGHQVFQVSQYQTLLLGCQRWTIPSLGPSSSRPCGLPFSARVTCWLFLKHL